MSSIWTLYGMHTAYDSDKAYSIETNIHNVAHEMKEILKTKHDDKILIRNIRTGTIPIAIAIGCKWLPKHKLFDIVMLAYDYKTEKIYDTINMSAMVRFADNELMEKIIGLLSIQNEKIMSKQIEMEVINRLEMDEKTKSTKELIEKNTPERIYMTSEKGFCYGKILSCVLPEIQQQFNFYDGCEDVLTYQNVTHNNKSMECATYGKDWCIVPVEFLRKDSVPELKQLGVKTIKGKHVTIVSKNGKPTIDDKYIMGDTPPSETGINDIKIAHLLKQEPAKHNSRENIDLTTSLDFSATNNNKQLGE